MFRRDDQGTPSEPTDDFWITEVELFRDDPEGGEDFGKSVSINGDRAIVGADQDDDSGLNSGSAYTFRRDDNGTPLNLTDDFWVQQSKLLASDGAAGDDFGSAVAIHGDWAFVGAHAVAERG